LKKTKFFCNPNAFFFPKRKVKVKTNKLAAHQLRNTVLEETNYYKLFLVYQAFQLFSNIFQIVLLDDAIHHVFRQPPGLPLLAGLVDAAEVLLAEADATKHCAERAKSSIRYPGQFNML